MEEDKRKTKNFGTHDLIQGKSENKRKEVVAGMEDITNLSIKFVKENGDFALKSKSSGGRFTTIENYDKEGASKYVRDSYGTLADKFTVFLDSNESQFVLKN